MRIRAYLLTIRVAPPTVCLLILIGVGTLFPQGISESTHDQHFAVSRQTQPGDKYQFQLLPAYSSMHYPVRRVDFTVTMRDGIILDCVKFIPDSVQPPQGGWPTVIMCHGFGENKDSLAGFCSAQAAYGYYTMTYSMRGQGNSGGLSNLISTVEMLDFQEIVHYVKNDSLSGSNPNKILVMGASQGGAIPYKAACNQTSVKTIISALAPPNFASSWIENGSIKTTFLWSVNYTPDIVRYAPQVVRMSNWVFADNRASWDSLAYWLPRDRDFTDQVQNCSVPLLIEGSWQDMFFNADGIMQSLSNLSAPYLSYLGAVKGHGGDTSHTEYLWHMQLFNDWFYYWLFSIPNGIMDIPRYQYAYTTLPFAGTMWSFVHDSSRIFLPQATTNYRLYFNRQDKLTLNPNNHPNDNKKFKNQVTGGLTMIEAVAEAFTGDRFNSKFRKEEIEFKSDPLSSDVRWVGTPTIRFDYSSSCQTFCQYNVQVYEIDNSTGGQIRFVNRINYTDRNYVQNSRRTATFRGQAHAHRFKAGNRILIKVTNLDTAPGDSTFLETFPFVLPVLKNGENKIYFSANSYIEFPVRPEIPLRVAEEALPRDFVLKQNYPNAFNPSTTIEYSLPISGGVELKVFDVLGREVKTLVNGYQPIGTHRAEFSAVNLASGVYFYRITVQESAYSSSLIFQDVKKMLLVK
jgi:predicted acyl esterase